MPAERHQPSTFSLCGRVILPWMNSPTPKVIAEVIDRLCSLQEGLRRIQDVANHGEDPQAAEQEAEKAAEFFRRLLDNPPASRKWSEQEWDELRARVVSLDEEGKLPSRLDIQVDMMKALSAVLRPLPIRHLKAVNAVLTLRTLLRDGEDIGGGFTIGDLKNMAAVFLADKERQMVESGNDARTRAFRDVAVILCPYEESLMASQPGALDKGMGSLTSAILTADVGQLDWVIHSFRKIGRRLGVEADQQKLEQKPNEQGQGGAPRAGAQSEEQCVRDRGRKPGYTVEFCRLVQNTYDGLLAKGIGSKGAWNQAAETHGIKSGDAARVQCRRYLRPRTEQ
ncbi:MAG: hypothetical protein ABFE13_16250 [Phycisphaerales bacterium]